MAALGQFHEGRDGGLRIGDDLPKDGDQISFFAIFENASKSGAYMVYSSFLVRVIKKGRESSRPFSAQTKKPWVPEEVPRLYSRFAYLISSGQTPSVVLFRHHQFCRDLFVIAFRSFLE